jgi:3-oxoadipate enol-lactonase
MTNDATLTQERYELERAGSRLAYWLDGPPDGPVVALTHGVSLDRHAFDEQVPALVAAGYRVLTWDIRGHGRSQPMGARLCLRTVADDLVAILDDLRVPRAVLVGQSFGGMVVQEVLDRHPDRALAMVVIGAPALGDRPGPVMRVLQRLRVNMVKAWPYPLLRWVFAKVVTSDPEVRPYVDRAARQLDKRRFIAVSVAAMDGYLRTGTAATHGVPVLLVHGEQEERSVLRGMQRWGDGDHGVTRATAVGGHLVNQENAAAFNEILVSFLHDHVPVDQDAEAHRDRADGERDPA